MGFNLVFKGLNNQPDALNIQIYSVIKLYMFRASSLPVAYLGGVWDFQTPPPEIPKISVESSIAQARRTGVSISFCSSLCSHTVVIY